MSVKSLIINPGSTSTKIGVFEDETLLFEETLRHSTEEISKYATIFDQKDLLPYLRRLGIYTIGTCLTAAVMLGVCSNISSESWFGFWGKTICCGVGANLCLLVFYFRLPEFSQGKALVLKSLKRSRR